MKIFKILVTLIIGFLLTNISVKACDPTLSDSIRYTEFAYVKVIEKDKKIENITDDKFIEVEVIEILNLKTFYNYYIGSKFIIGLSSETYEKIKDFDEFIVSDLSINNSRKGTNQDDIIYIERYTGMLDGLVPLKNGKVSINEFSYDIDYSYYSAINMLLDGNFKEGITFKDGMSVGELEEYFARRFEKFGTKGQCSDDFSRNYQFLIIAVYILIPVVGVTIIVLLAILVRKIIRKRRI